MALTDLVRVLEAVPLVAAEYGIPSGDLKPCIAYLLDGNVGGAARHASAFTIAISLRQLDWSQEDVLTALRRWADKVGYNERGCRSAVKSAFTRSGSKWRYHPPGLVKRPGGRYYEVLEPICREVGCPANCAPFRGVFQGSRTEGWARFEALQWRAELHRRRHSAGIDVYLAICKREEELRIAPGAFLLTSFRQLAAIAQRDHRTVGRSLRHLNTDGLIEFSAGSGSGPHARDRVPSRVRRVVPIPPPDRPPSKEGPK